jgi:hypothetical protein
MVYLLVSITEQAVLKFEILAIRVVYIGLDW